jgi:hypothetical protein
MTADAEVAPIVDCENGLPYLRKTYDATTFPFAEMVRRHLAIPDLRDVHEVYPSAVPTTESDQHTPLHDALYGVGPEFSVLYRRFVAALVVPDLGQDVVFQKRPNFRFQPPGSTAVRRWHKDSEFGHSVHEINYWVPLTTATVDNCVWIAPSDDPSTAIPMPCEPGEVLVFSGATLRHGNKPNQSDRTRVSFEFRVIPRDRYEARDETSVVMGKQFALGDYFDEFDESERISGAR